MGLSDIATGVEVTAEQQDRGVATIDEMDGPLAERLAEYTVQFPCTADEAATVVEVYAEGRSIGTAARSAGLAPITAAKTLHLLGEQVMPLGPTARDVLRDWMAGDISRTEALRLTDVSDQEFALAAYVETHDPIDGAREAVAAELSTGLGTDGLGETMSDVGDLRER
jgi:hypothetical protein